MNVFRTIRGDWGFLRDIEFPGNIYTSGYVIINDQLYGFDIDTRSDQVSFITQCNHDTHTGIIAAINRIDKNNQYKILADEGFYAHN